MFSGVSWAHSKGVVHRHRMLCHQTFSDLVCGICNTFLVFDLALACLDCQYSQVERCTDPCMHLKVKSRILNTILFLQEKSFIIRTISKQMPHYKMGSSHNKRMNVVIEWRSNVDISSRLGLRLAPGLWYLALSTDLTRVDFTPGLVLNKSPSGTHLSSQTSLYENSAAIYSLRETSNLHSMYSGGGHYI